MEVEETPIIRRAKRDWLPIRFWMLTRLDIVVYPSLKLLT
jgi:hypothetical protein